MPVTTTGVPPTYLDANRLWVDSALRARAQRSIEAPVLVALGGRVEGGRVLELGTGRRGTGLRLALEVFGAATADGVELSADSVVACRTAVADLGSRVRIEVGDADALAAPGGVYDAVFCWHVLHHAGDWRAVLAEGARVLRPGGRLYAVDMTARLVDSRALRAVSRHPADGDRPTPGSTADALRDAGLQVLGQRIRYAGCWVATVARRPAAPR